jgi:predicted TIM-barrel fold metal-dependent hydrolase
MDLSKLADMPITDAHVHFGDVRLMPEVTELMDSTGVDQFNLLSTPRRDIINLNPQVLYFKAHHPERVYMFGALDYSRPADGADPALVIPLAEQVDRLMLLGCDGIKMVEGKPEVRKRIGLPFDGDVYADFFARAAEQAVPILWHVGDPEEFWDWDRLPQWAKDHGWFYDETAPALESLYSEVANVLARNPTLTVIFAHFYFLSAQLPRAAELLDRYPNVNLDVTPGVEMYHNFTANYDAARDFFLRYQDRIIFGTDSGAQEGIAGERHINMEVGQGRIWMVRNALETGEVFDVPYDPLMTPDDRPAIRGVALPPESLEKLYTANFQRLAGAAPKTLDMDLVNQELERMAALVDASGAPTNPAREVMESLAT